MRTRRRQVISVLVVVLVAAGSLIYTFVARNQPLLGLDLAGGVSVVLKPKQAVGDEQLQQAIAIIRQRIDAIGVAEPEISQQGDNILIQIPGVQDRERAIQLVGQTAELRFRPVISECRVATEAAPTTIPPGSVPPGSTPGAPTGSAPVDPNASTTTAPSGAPAPSPVPVTEPPSTTAAPSAPPSSSRALAPATPSEGESAAGPALHEQVRSGLADGIQAQTPIPSDPAPSTPGAPGQSPVVVPGQTPTVPGQSPVVVPGQTPTVPGQSPVVVPGQTPTVPGETPTVPGQPGISPTQAGAGGTTPIFQGAACPPNVTEMITKPEAEKPDQPAILPGFSDENDPKKITEVYQLGPVNARGNILSDASASLSQQSAQWIVNPKFKPGKEGIDVFNESAKVCKPAGAQCPTGQQAITLDGRVVSAPRIQPDEQAFKPFSADQVQISGSFNEKSAKELATQLKYGALPVELVQQQVQTVSETLGKDALQAGLISGFVGLGIVVIYMLGFYRLLGAMAITKLAVEGAVLWSIIALLGTHAGLALTLAGVTGLIVSIGTSLDSNVVYYEHLKEDLRHGRTLRSSVDRAFQGSFKTILKADGVSILGAALLYMLSVGPVRGFAFYLVLAEVFDLLTSRYYLYPAMLLLCRSKLAQNRPGLFGLPGVDMTASNLATAGAEARTIARRPSRTKGTDRPPEKAVQGDESAGDEPVRVPSDTNPDESEGSSS